ncbi:MAG: carbohydrate porin [Chloroflexi bacterium]|nr:carbohydrate porin [Chloroflexota bacterium]
MNFAHCAALGLLILAGSVGAEEKYGLVEGYTGDSARLENPTNIDADLNASFPQNNAVFDSSVPKNWFAWKQGLYADTGLKLGMSYQSLYQHASETLTGNDTAWAGWLLVEAKWDAFNKGEDYQGGLVATLDWRHTIGGNSAPGFFQLDTGSQWASDFSFVDWDVWFPALYWEQWLDKDKFVLRVGNQVAPQFIDFFRFKDSRVSFSSGPFTAAAQSIPSPQPGFGVSFRWTPIEASEFYVAGTVNDSNAVVNEFGWGDIFENGQFFYGVEFGYSWRRSRSDFDHLHLLVFYADETDMLAPVFPNKAGGGFKLAGSKQWDRLVAFASYTYNTHEGGGFGTTLSKQVITAGLAVQRPLNVGGEVGVGATWAEPLDDVTLAVVPQRPSPADQWGMEFYWRILLTQDLWITPSLQFVVNPTFNAAANSIVIPGLKFRWFL